MPTHELFPTAARTTQSGRPTKKDLVLFGGPDRSPLPPGPTATGCPSWTTWPGLHGESCKPHGWVGRGPFNPEYGSVLQRGVVPPLPLLPAGLPPPPFWQCPPGTVAKGGRAHGLQTSAMRNVSASCVCAKCQRYPTCPSNGLNHKACLRTKFCSRIARAPLWAFRWAWPAHLRRHRQRSAGRSPAPAGAASGTTATPAGVRTLGQGSEWARVGWMGFLGGK